LVGRTRRKGDNPDAKPQFHRVPRARWKRREDGEREEAHVHWDHSIKHKHNHREVLRHPHSLKASSHGKTASQDILAWGLGSECIYIIPSSMFRFTQVVSYTTLTGTESMMIFTTS
jgi:hypothetical protein